MKKTISNILGILCMATTLLLSSCQTKVDQSQCRDQLVGEWRMTYERQMTQYDEETSLNDSEWIGTSFIFCSDGKLILRSRAGKTHEGTWSLNKKGLALQYRVGNHYNGIITKINDTTLELELKCTEDGYDGYLTVIWKFGRVN